VSDDLEKVRPEADEAARDDADDVEAHTVRPAEDRAAAATEEGPDVEGHMLKPKVKP
jgi:hypothetical protein